ncbi:MAG: efflux RND transporter permease subunit [Alphaproteobacteria bacterium]|nr:efflux RND transporter permease subunit [Alphaproteobacteria bacterium]
MDLIKLSIDKPTAVIAAVIMAVLFGLVALNTIPIQMSPDVSRPVIRITTDWLGAAPAEVEREITTKQEDALKGLVGIEQMTSRSRQSRSQIDLEFTIGTDMDKALLLVSNRLDGVTDYPDEAKEPKMKVAGPEDNRIAWFHMTRLEGNDRPIETYGDFVTDVIQERLERVPGVATVNVYGGSEREMRVIVDPAKLARYHLTVPEVLRRLRAANVSSTGGAVDEGKRRYVVRTEGELLTPEAVRQVVLRTEQDTGTGRVGRVIVGDVADVNFGYKETVSLIRTNGTPAIAVNATREVGANVIETMDGIYEAVRELNSGPVQEQGLKFVQMYDETDYINSAIHLVVQNIWVGGIFAVLILLLFLRSIRATLVVALSIPVSVIASFVAMAMLGRSLNVVSLAGIAFAVGMVVDAAIVVLENIYRLRQKGQPAPVAALLGARQVWGAILVSALTTVLVFVPILTMDLEVGQLFRDIAVAISVAVMLSLLVSVTVIPALANRLLVKDVPEAGKGYRIPVVDAFATKFVAFVTGVTRRAVNNRGFALCMALGITLAAAGVTWLLKPPLEYLPEGNRNLIIGVVFPPPGYNLKAMSEIADQIESDVKPHIAVFTGPESAPGEPPKMKYFVYVVHRNRMFLVARSVEPGAARGMIPTIREAGSKEPGTFIYTYQRSIFGRGIAGSRSVDLDIKGLELDQIVDVAQRAVELVRELYPPSEGGKIRPRPGLELGEPEVRIVPNRIRLADSGLNARDLTQTIDAFNDGVRVAEINVGGKQMDLTLKGPDKGVDATQGIESLPVVTGSGTILPVRSLATVDVVAGPTEIRHADRSRAITLQIGPPEHVALGTAIEQLQEQVIDKLRAEGLPTGISLRLSGTADKLVATANEMKWDLLIALVIVFLVMAVLFESFIYPLIIVLSVPVATAGGFVGLEILSLFHYQQLDMLTLLGFVILIGIVVNNAILIVHQTLYLIREEGLRQDDAIVEATRNRIRPIFMSTLTSVFGMLPLVLFPGAGSELYRGLGSVVLGGLSLSAVLTLGIVPPLMSLFCRVFEPGGKASPRPVVANGADDYPKAAE